MSAFTIHKGKVVVLPGDAIDTDRIIPARFLSMVTRTGYGELLFADVRGPSFPLDQPESQGASILIVGSNFGCGSSREHAVWAIQQAGFRAVIARKSTETPGYSDIFRGNAGNCGLCLIEVNESDHQLLASSPNGSELTIDLPSQTIVGEAGTIHFEINPATKDQLLKGLDLVGMTLEYESKIAEFEKRMTSSCV